MNKYKVIWPRFGWFVVRAAHFILFPVWFFGEKIDSLGHYFAKWWEYWTERAREHDEPADYLPHLYFSVQPNNIDIVGCDEVTVVGTCSLPLHHSNWKWDLNTLRGRVTLKTYYLDSQNNEIEAVYPFEYSGTIAKLSGHRIGRLTDLFGLTLTKADKGVPNRAHKATVPIEVYTPKVYMKSTAVVHPNSNVLTTWRFKLWIEEEWFDDQNNRHVRVVKDTRWPKRLKNAPHDLAGHANITPSINNGELTVLVHSSDGTALDIWAFADTGPFCEEQGFQWDYTLPDP